jgi:hypothetical protein
LISPNFRIRVLIRWNVFLSIPNRSASHCRISTTHPHHGGRGYPPVGPAQGWGGDPLPKKRRRGVGGSPPSPPCPQTAVFRHGLARYFAWNLRRGVMVLQIFRQVRVPPGRALRGEGGDPLLARHMGGGVIPSPKKERGGGRGITPLPPLSANARIFSWIRS